MSATSATGAACHGLVDVGQHRQADLGLDAREDRRPASSPGRAKRREDVRLALSNEALNTRARRRGAAIGNRVRQAERVRLALDDARPGDQRERRRRRGDRPDLHRVHRHIMA